MVLHNHLTYPALSIAKYLIWKSNKSNKDTSNKKLQKLIYYCQAWNLALNDQPMFVEQIEAWVHGPTVRTIYQKYKKFGYGPINEKIEDENIIDLNIDKKTVNMIDNVLDVYGKYDADYLEILTHSEEPWQNAREGLSNNELSTAIISHDDMKNYYRKLLKK